jgi:hypothetical protein
LIPLAENVGENAEGFANFVTWLLGIIPMAIGFINALISMGEWFVNTVRLIGDWVQRGKEMFVTGFNATIDFLLGLPGRIGEIFQRVKDSVLQKIGEVVAEVRSWPGRLLSALGNLDNLLWDAGARLVGGFIQSIKNKFNEVKATLSNLTSLLPSWKGPEHVDSKLLTHSGKVIMDSLVDGFRLGERGIKSYLGELTGFVGGFGPDIGRLPGGGSGAHAAGVSRIVIGSDGSRMGDALISLLSEAIRDNGGDPTVLLGGSGG